MAYKLTKVIREAIKAIGTDHIPLWLVYSLDKRSGTQCLQAICTTQSQAMMYRKTIIDSGIFFENPVLSWIDKSEGNHLFANMFNEVFPQDYAFKVDKVSDERFKKIDSLVNR